MPTHDFQCKKCGHSFEFSRPFGSSTVPACPECKSKKTEKMIAPPAIHFKGAGFYKTDASAAKPAKKTESAAPEISETKKVDSPEKLIEKPKKEAD